MSRWPEGRRAAVSLSFDNLGEAAELELGLRSADEPLGGHYSVTTALPVVLGELAARDLRATFFVEGLNAEVYPDALRGIAAAGHEVALHAWRHEEWNTLDPAAEASNLRRCIAAARAIGLPPRGFRPPGGLLNAGTLELLLAEGLSYCSPAGSAAGVDGVVLLPFTWRATDVFHFLPQFEALRAAIDGDGTAGGPDDARAAIEAAVGDAVAEGTHLSIVLHTWAAEFELDALRAVLDHVAAAVTAGELWAARHDEAADWIASHPGDFTEAPVLDTRSWLTGA